jgi:hypothetical protein
MEHTQSVPHMRHITSPLEPNRLILFTETVAVYCENRTKHTDTVRTSHETHYVSAKAQPVNAIYCENYTEHTETVRTSQETHHVSTTEPNRLILFGEAS